MFALLALLVFQVVSAIADGSAAESPRTAVGSEVPSLALFAIESMRSADLNQLTSAGCGWIYVFDVDCPACKKALSFDSGAAPPTEGPNLDFVYWLSLDQEAARIRRALLSRSRTRVTYFASSREELRGLPLTGIPALWKVEEGVITAEATGVSTTSRNAIGARSDFSCRTGDGP